MSKYYSEMLLNGIPNNSDMQIQDIPLIINTIEASYPFAFLDYEEEDVLGVNYTADDGTERFIVINKKHIINIEILYQQDIDILMSEDMNEDDSDVMYQ